MLALFVLESNEKSLTVSSVKNRDNFIFSESSLIGKVAVHNFGSNPDFPIFLKGELS